MGGRLRHRAGRAGAHDAPPLLGPRPARPEWLVSEVRRLAERPLDHSHLTGLPDGETTMLAGQLVLDWLNCTGERGLCAVVRVPAMRDLEWAFDADAAGEVWRQVADRLRRLVPPSAFLGHPESGPVLYAWGFEDSAAIDALLAGLLAAFDEPFEVAGRHMYLHANVGALVYPDDYGRIEDQAVLASLVHTALASLPADSRRRIARWSSSERVRLVRRVWVDQLLLNPAERSRMRLVFQPRFRTSDGACVAAEALTRWTDPDLGEISPSEFIPIAEANGTILAITEGTLAGVTSWLGASREWLPGGFRVGVNISATLVESVGLGLVGMVADALRRHGCPGSCLELELTEAAVIDVGAETVRQVVAGWRALGVHVALDDFGSGYSSLALLGEVPLDLLKVDRSVVRSYERDPADRRLLSAIAATARAFDLPIVIEGVERETTLPCLREMGLEMAQGNALSPPVDALRLERRLRSPARAGAGERAEVAVRP